MKYYHNKQLAMKADLRYLFFAAVSAILLVLVAINAESIILFIYNLSEPFSKLWN